jgi:hypothetical protein
MMLRQGAINSMICYVLFHSVLHLYSEIFLETYIYLCHNATIHSPTITGFIKQESLYTSCSVLPGHFQVQIPTGIGNTQYVMLFTVYRENPE